MSNDLLSVHCNLGSSGGGRGQVTHSFTCGYLVLCIVFVKKPMCLLPLLGLCLFLVKIN